MQPLTQQISETSTSYRTSFTEIIFQYISTIIYWITFFIKSQSCKHFKNYFPNHPNIAMFIIVIRNFINISLKFNTICHAIFMVHNVSNKNMSNSFVKSVYCKNVMFIKFHFRKELFCSPRFKNTEFSNSFSVFYFIIIKKTFFHDGFECQLC